MKFTLSPGALEYGVLLRDDKMIFFVKDSGIGIPPEKQAAVFERFQQVDSSVRRVHTGTGLGLTISKCLVELLGVREVFLGFVVGFLTSLPFFSQGTIWLESSVGGGTTFFFSHPFEQPVTVKVALPPPGISGEGAKAHPSGRQDFPPRSILLVEDNFINQRVTETMLRKAGCEVMIAGDGQGAIECFQEGLFDCVLMDIQMPVMDGITTTKLIREFEKTHGKKRVVIVALTANAMQGDMERYLTLGFGRRIFPFSLSW